MAEGIEFLLELEANLQGATDMLGALKKVEGQLESTDRALEGAEKKVGLLGRAKAGLGKAAHAAGEQINDFAKESLAHLTALASFEGLKRLGEGLLDLGKDAILAAAGAQRSETAFHNLLGSKVGGELLEDVNALKGHMEFTEDTVKSFTLTLARAGFEGDGLRRSLALTGDIASRFENKMEGAQTALSLLSTVELGGGIKKGQLRAIGVDVKDFYKDLSQQFGIGQKDVQAAIDSGKIPENDLIGAIERHVVKPGAKLGDEAVAASHTLSAKLDKLAAAPDQLLESVKDTKGFEQFTESLDRLLTAMDPDSPQGKRITGTLGELFDRFGKFVKEVDVDEWSKKTVGGLEGAADAAKVLLVTLDALATTVSGFKVAGKAVGDVALKAEMGLRETKGIGIWDSIVEGFTDPLHIKQAQRDAEMMGAGLGEAAKKGTKDELEIHSPSRVFERLGEQTTEGFTQGLRSGAPDVYDQAGATFGAGAAAAGSSWAAGPGGGGANISIGDVVVHVTAPGGDARETGHVVAATVREHLMLALEGAVLEGKGG